MKATIPSTVKNDSATTSRSTTYAFYLLVGALALALLFAFAVPFLI